MRPRPLLLGLSLALGPATARADARVTFFRPPRVVRAAPSEGVLLRLGAEAVSAEQAGQGGLPPAGRTVSLDLVDADLHSVLRLLGEVADLDFVVDDGVRARVTVQLQDVPWNHALAAILHANGLTAVPLDGGGVVHIVPLG